MHVPQPRAPWCSGGRYVFLSPEGGHIIIGLVAAGPWITMAAARVTAQRTSRPGTLIAARRLADDPRAAFRAVSGLVLALFITTVTVVAITTQDAKNLTRWGSAAAAGVVTDQLADQQQPGSASQGQLPTTGSGPAASIAPLAARLRGIPGVQGVIVVRAVGAGLHKEGPREGACDARSRNPSGAARSPRRRSTM
jgi:hypothetical protein